MPYIRMETHFPRAARLCQRRTSKDDCEDERCDEKNLTDASIINLLPKEPVVQAIMVAIICYPLASLEDAPPEREAPGKSKKPLPDGNRISGKEKSSIK